MAIYTFGVPYCIIHEIRSLRTDTLIASTSLQVMNAQGALHQDYGTTPTADLGDFSSGSMVNTNLFWSNIDVPDPTPDLPDGGAAYWSFVLTNSGDAKTNPSVITTAINNVAAGVIGALVQAGQSLGSSGDFMEEIAAGAVAGALALLQLLTANCDGVVAAFGLAFTAAELAVMTQNPANWPQVMNFQGTNTPSGCGKNSNYDAHYVIANVSSVTVPNLIDKSPAVAKALATAAGLVYSEADQKTGPPGSAPVVIGQTPPANTVVTPGSSLEAAVQLATPKGHPQP
jgi:PASTA domain